MATGIVFSLWMRTSGIGTAIFTGYILWLGGDKTTDIPFLMSLSYFASLVQLLSVNYTSCIRNKKRFVVACGFVEIFFRFAVIAVPVFLMAAAPRMIAVYILVAIGLSFGYVIVPILSDWLSTTIPENMRGRYTGQRTFWMTVAGIVGGYLCGKFLDLYAHSPDRTVQYTGFAQLLTLGFAFGVLGYVILLRAPVPPQSEEKGGGVLDAMAGILRNKSFVRLLTFCLARQFVVGLSMPFYMVYFIDDLKLSYTDIAIYTNIALFATIIAYRSFAPLVDRFGSKPIMQILVIPGALGQLLRVFASKDFPYLVPVSMSIYAMYHAGMLVSLSPMLYGLLPRKGNRQAYFAAWTASVLLAGGLGPIFGSVLASRLKDFHQVWFGFPVGNLQLVFVCTTVGLLALMPLVLVLEEKKAETASALFSYIRKGNPIAYVYNSLSLNYLSGETSRVRAAAGLGRSGSPLAGEDLIKALEDISPEVRRKAAEGLGELGADEAVGSLIEQVADKESDIRAEAAEALGKIGHPLGIDAVIDALRDQRPSVRICAIRGLGEIGGEGVRQLLYQRLAEHEFDRHMFPTLLDVLSKLGETRLVRIALERLREFQSPVVRTQILNSVCRSLGAEETFYRLAVLDELKQATRIGAALQKAQKGLSRLKEPLTWKEEIVEDLGRIRQEFEDGDYQETLRLILKATGDIVDYTSPEGLSGQLDPDAITLARGAAGALLLFASTLGDEAADQQEFIFATVCFCLCLTEIAGAGQTANGSKNHDRKNGSGNGKGKPNGGT